MKARFHLAALSLAVCLTAPASLGEESVNLDQVPPAVRERIGQAAKADPVKKVTRRTIGGQIVYVVELEKKHAINPILRITEGGELLPYPPMPVLVDGMGPALDPEAASAFDSAVNLNDLPAAVQETVRKEARGREIGDIDEETWDGQPVYEVEFRARGFNPQIHVARDGTIVRGEKSRDRSAGNFFLGTQLADTPPAVQETIRREAAGRAIDDIDIERRSGAVVYEVEIREAEAGTFQLHLNTEGQILRDSRSKVPQPKP